MNYIFLTREHPAPSLPYTTPCCHWSRSPLQLLGVTICGDRSSRATTYPRPTILATTRCHHPNMLQHLCHHPVIPSAISRRPAIYRLNHTEFFLLTLLIQHAKGIQSYEIPRAHRLRKRHDSGCTALRPYCGCAVGLLFMLKQLLSTSLMEGMKPGCQGNVESGETNLS